MTKTAREPAAPEPAPKPVRRLNTHELEELVRWFTVHMPAEMRCQLMGDLPVLYKLLYPSVSDDVLLAKVTARLRQVEGQSDLLPHLRNL